MKYCSYCGNELNDDEVFCGKCGKQIVIKGDNKHKKKEKRSTGNRIAIIGLLFIIVLSLIAGFMHFQMNRSVADGNAFLKKEQYEMAMSAFDKAEKYKLPFERLDLTENKIQTYIGWGNALCQTHEYQDAIDKYNGALELDESLDLNIPIGNAYCDLGISQLQEGNEVQAMLTMMEGCDHSDIGRLRVWINALSEYTSIEEKTEDGDMVYSISMERDFFGLITKENYYKFDPKFPGGEDWDFIDNPEEFEFISEYGYEKQESNTYKIYDKEDNPNTDYWIVSLNKYGLAEKEQRFSDGQLYSSVESNYDNYGRVLDHQTDYYDEDTEDTQYIYHYDTKTNRLLSWDEVSEKTITATANEWDEAGRPTVYDYEETFGYYKYTDGIPTGNDIENTYLVRCNTTYDHNYLLDLQEISNDQGTVYENGIKDMERVFKSICNSFVPNTNTSQTINLQFDELDTNQYWNTILHYATLCNPSLFIDNDEEYTMTVGALKNLSYVLFDHFDGKIPSAKDYSNVVYKNGDVYSFKHWEGIDSDFEIKEIKENSDKEWRVVGEFSLFGQNYECFFDLVQNEKNNANEKESFEYRIVSVATT